MAAKFCDITARKIDELTLPDSYEDSFTIEELGTLEVNSKFNDFEIGRLMTSARVQGYETDLEIDGLGKDARLITIDGKFNKLYLDVSGVPFELKGDMQFGDVDYPEGDVERRVYIKENNKLQIEIVSKSGTPQLSIDLKGYETKAEIQ